MLRGLEKETAALRAKTIERDTGSSKDSLQGGIVGRTSLSSAEQGKGATGGLRDGIARLQPQKRTVQAEVEGDVAENKLAQLQLQQLVLRLSASLVKASKTLP